MAFQKKLKMSVNTWRHFQALIIRGMQVKKKHEILLYVHLMGKLRSWVMPTIRGSEVQRETGMSVPTGGRAHWCSLLENDLDFLVSDQCRYALCSLPFSSWTSTPKKFHIYKSRSVWRLRWKSEATWCPSLGNKQNVVEAIIP